MKLYLYCVCMWLIASGSCKSNSKLKQDESGDKDIHKQDTTQTPPKVPSSFEVEKVEIKIEEHKEDIAEIHSSFGESIKEKNEDASQADESILQRLDLEQKITETAGEGIVFTLVDTVGAELRNRAASDPYNVPTSSNQTKNKTEDDPYVVRAQPKPQEKVEKQEEIVMKVDIETNTTSNTTIPDPSQEETEKPKTVENAQEDIPSFSEWAQKQLAEAEKKKNGVNITNDKATKSKVRNKNYASPDCGAKIIAANPEAVSRTSVLSASRDEYMLNYCTSRIWFVVELCEAIQAHQLDLANFELFSSSPKEFSVYISNRFPTRDWNHIGKFSAEDNRDVQTFHLSPQIFGKFIKIEIHSHYGKEHFCPVSLVRIYGTSEYEALATEDDRHDSASTNDDDDDDEEEDTRRESKDIPKNLFTSATDAVLSIVKKATAPFMKKDENNNDTVEIAVLDSVAVQPVCVTPRYIIVCDNCSNSLYDKVYKTLSCQQTMLNTLVVTDFVRNNFIDNNVCNGYGLQFYNLNTKQLPLKPNIENYLTAILPEYFIASLCNYLAVIERRVAVNNTLHEASVLKNLTDADTWEDGASPSPICSMLTDCIYTDTALHLSTSSHLEDYHTSPYIMEQIQPTKTLTENEIKQKEPVSDFILIETEVPTSATQSEIVPTITVNMSGETEEAKVSFIDPGSNEDTQDVNIDLILEEISELPDPASLPSSSTTPAPPTNPVPKESTFIRLANRIKNLEVNMSLSSSYLEEMSRRYRQQLDALAKTVNASAQRVQEQTRVSEEREKKLEDAIMLLQSQVTNLSKELSFLLKERNSWRSRAAVIGQHALLIVVEALVFLLVFIVCKRNRENNINDRKPEEIKKPNKKERKLRRRNSVECLTGHKSPQRGLQRRPSEEALEIALATNYRPITEIDGRIREKKKKRKKKDGSRKNSSNVNPEMEVLLPPKFAESSSSITIFQRVEDLPNVDLVTANRFAPFASPVKPVESNGAVVKEHHRRSSAPIFMKTAAASRSMRVSPEISSLKTVLNSPNDIRESSPEPSTSKREPSPIQQKKSGIRRYMKKLF